jgi:L-ascorbate metabolism protein UlaG (beta-lactamase superfamily)
MTNTKVQLKSGVGTIRRAGLHAMRVSTITLLAAATAVFVATAATAQNTAGATDNTVKITPLGAHTGDFCATDRALLFEDPTGVRILYDPGVTVAGGQDPRLGEVHAILVSHSHYDHIGYRKLTQNPDDPKSSCDNPQSAQVSNTTTAEIAAVKNSVVAVNGSMGTFLDRKIQNILPGWQDNGCTDTGMGKNQSSELIVPQSSPCGITAAFGSLIALTRTAGAPGVRINTVAAQHSDSLYNPLLLFRAHGYGKVLDDNGLQGYDGLANGFVLTFSNGLKVYLTGDTGPTSDMALVVRDIYHPNLTVANVDGANNMGPMEGAYAMKVLVHTTAVIPSHAEEAVTVNGKLVPGTPWAEFIRLLGDIPAYLPLSGRTMEFDGHARCVAGCGER